MAEQKIAVVTGALRGLGLETARQLASRGCRVVITGRDEARGKQVLAGLAKQDLHVMFRYLDVSKTESIEAFVATVSGDFGRVDILVNNAGIMIDGNEPATRLADYAAVIEATLKTNAIGPFLLCKALVPAMLHNGFGRIVNVSSGMGQLSDMNGGYPGYRMSKTALNTVTRMVADETRGTNVLINSVCPGWVRTDMGGSGANRTVEEGADTIVWLATLPDGSPSGGFFRDRQPIPW